MSGRRINRCIDLLAAGHPVYYTDAGALDYDNGRAQAHTWADFLVVDFERDPFDTVGLRAFMRGLVDGGPTPDGYRMPTVIATLPGNCKSVAEVEANAWQIRHALACGVHGILHTHARDPAAVRAFVAHARFPFHEAGRDRGLAQGQRGSGGQEWASQLWGLDPVTYTMAAEPWPLNPDGELLLGLKLEDRDCLETAAESAAVPGIAFAEWGPGDMGMSFGHPDAHDPPYPEELENARGIVRQACADAGIHFLSAWNEPGKSEEERLRYLFDWGVTVVAGANESMKATGLRLRPRG